MRYLIFLFSMLALASQAQLWDDFSDEDLTGNPTWSGDLQKFRFSSSQAIPVGMRPALQLNSEGEGTAYLSLSREDFPGMQWDFWIKLSFNSSSSNFARIYLSSDSINPGEA